MRCTWNMPLCGLALLAVWLLSPQPAMAQSPAVRAVILDKLPAPVVASGCSQATSFLARTSGLSANYQTQYTNLICGLVTDGIFFKCDALYVFKSSSTGNAQLSLVSATFNVTLNNTPTFTADQGYTGNGSNMSIDTNFDPTTASSPNFVANSATFFVWSNTSAADNNSAGGDVGEHTAIYQRQGSTSFFNINDLSYDSVSNSDGSGMYSVSRTGATTKAAYKNGSSVISNSTAESNLANELFFLRSAGFSAIQVAGGGACAGLTAAENGNLYTRYNTFMSSTP